MRMPTPGGFVVVSFIALHVMYMVCQPEVKKVLNLTNVRKMSSIVHIVGKLRVHSGMGHVRTTGGPSWHVAHRARKYGAMDSALLSAVPRETLRPTGPADGDTDASSTRILVAP